MSILKTTLSVALILTSAGTAQAQFPAGWGFSIARRYVGPQIRQASPWAYSGLLAANRMVPPQVKNQWSGYNRYRGAAGTPWNGELNYIRSLPPEVRNSIGRQERPQFQRGGYVTAPPPVVIYVPVPVPVSSATVFHGAGAANTAVIPAPPNPSELPRIIRPN